VAYFYKPIEGMLSGSLFKSIWGGPKTRIAFTAFVGYFTIPITNALANAVTQSKVARDMQRRYGGVSQMLTSIAMPLGYLSVGPLADQVFEPLMASGGALAGNLGIWLGVGPGRGIGLLLTLSGILFGMSALTFHLNPRARRVEIELPDTIRPK
jgi:hypothetical protein